MGAPTKAPPRERLLEAAAELFYSEGYEVSIDRIAARAAVAKPTVYAHFASKEALIEAVLERGSVGFFADLDAELARRAGDADAQLLAAFDLLVSDLPDPGYHGCICINAAASFPSSSHPSHRVLGDLEERMLRIFSELAAAGGVDDPDALARQLLLLFDGVKARGLVDTSGESAGDAKAAASALLERARSESPA
jgi:AcrR family transcriptional regulator